MFPRNRRLFRSDRQRIGSRLAGAVSLFGKPFLIILTIGWLLLTDGMGDFPNTRKGWKRLGVVLALIAAAICVAIAMN